LLLVATDDEAAGGEGNRGEERQTEERLLEK
jgi:hypothetical protein